MCIQIPPRQFLTLVEQLVAIVSPHPTILARPLPAPAPNQGWPSPAIFWSPAIFRSPALARTSSLLKDSCILPLNQLVDCWISIGCPPHKRRWLSCVWPSSSLTHLIDVSTPAEVFSFYVRFVEKAASCWWRLGSARVAKILPPLVTLPWIQTNSVIIMSRWWKWCKIPRWIKAWSLRGWWPHVLMFPCMRARFNSPLRNRIKKTITTILKFLWRYVCIEMLQWLLT